MKRQTGFTLIELMVVVAILGILAGTAIGFQKRYRERTVGAEALVMMKQLLEGEIIYFLAHNEFFPKDPGPANEIWVYHDGGGTSVVDQQRALDELKVALPFGHLLDFHIYRVAAGSPVRVEIFSAGNFNLFPGVPRIRGTVNNQGTITGPDPF